MVLYYSGTGNSRYIAKRISQNLGDTLNSLNERIKSCDTSPLDTGKHLIIVTPTYAWRIPRIVQELLINTELRGAEKVWFVMDCGSEIGNAAKYNAELSREKGLEYMGTFQIIMPENYIAMFAVPGADEARQIVSRAEPLIESAAEYIRSESAFPKPKNSIYYRFISGPVNPIFYAHFVKTSAFTVSDKCISCGKCASLCPTNCIAITDGRPVWTDGCTHCMACISYCPAKAIEYGKKSIGKPRYTFEAL